MSLPEFELTVEGAKRCEPKVLLDHSFPHITGAVVYGGWNKTLNFCTFSSEKVKFSKYGFHRELSVGSSMIGTIVPGGQNAVLVGCSVAMLRCYTFNSLLRDDKCATYVKRFGPTKTTDWNWIYGIDYSPTKHLVLSGCQDKTTTLWKHDSQELQSALENDDRDSADSYIVPLIVEKESITKFPTNSWTYCVKFLSSEYAPNLIGSSNQSGDILLHDIEKEKLIKSLTNHHTNFIYNFCFEEKRNLIFSCSRGDKHVKIYDLKSEKVVNESHYLSHSTNTFGTVQGGLGCICIFEDKDEIVFGEYFAPYYLYIYDLKMNKIRKTIERAHEGSIRRIVAISERNSNYFCTCSDDKTMKIFDRNQNDSLVFDVKEKNDLYGMTYLPKQEYRLMKQAMEDLKERVEYVWTNFVVGGDHETDMESSFARQSYQIRMRNQVLVLVKLFM